MQCRNFQYEVGKEYEMDGEIKCCNRGFHACKSPMEVWEYYDMLNSRYAEVEQSGKIEKEKNSTKVCSSRIKIKAELKLADIINIGVEWLKDITSTSKVKADGVLNVTEIEENRLAHRATLLRLAHRATLLRLAHRATMLRLAHRATLLRLAHRATLLRLAHRATMLRLDHRATMLRLAHRATMLRLAHRATLLRLAHRATMLRLAHRATLLRLAHRATMLRLAHRATMLRLAHRATLLRLRALEKIPLSCVLAIVP